MPLRDPRQVGQRPGQALGQQPGAVGGHRPVDRVEQAAGAFARERAGQLQVGAGRSVDRKRRARRLAGRHRERSAGGELCAGDVEKAGPGRLDLGPGEAAEAVERRDTVLLAHPPLGRGGLQLRLRQRDDGGPALLPDPRQGRIGVDRLGQDDLAGIVPGDRAGEIPGGHLAQREAAGGDVDGGETIGGRALPGLAPPDRQQQVGAGGIEQAVLGDGARRDEAHHLPPHHRFRAAPFGLGGILGLLADGHPVAHGDEAAEVVVRPVHRDAAHRDLGAAVAATLGQHDAERPRRDLRVAEEQLVEISHPVEQEAIGIGRFDLDILRHHGRGAGRIQGGGGRFGGGADGSSGHGAS